MESLKQGQKEWVSDAIRDLGVVAKDSLRRNQFSRLWQESEEIKNSVNSKRVFDILDSIVMKVFQDGFEEGVKQTRARESILPKGFKFSAELFPESMSLINDLIAYKEKIPADFEFGHIRHAMTSASQHLELMREQNAVLYRKINKAKKILDEYEAGGAKFSALRDALENESEYVD